MCISVTALGYKFTDSWKIFIRVPRKKVNRIKITEKFHAQDIKDCKKQIHFSLVFTTIFILIGSKSLKEKLCCSAPKSWH